MKLKEAARAAGVSDKTARRIIGLGLVPGPEGKGPRLVHGRNGMEYDLMEADVEALKAAKATAGASKAERNRAHRSEVLATAQVQERKAGGQAKVRTIRALGRGGSTREVLAAIGMMGPEILRDRWLLLITFYQTRYGTANPVELRSQAAVLPQTVQRTLRQMRREEAETRQQRFKV